MEVELKCRYLSRGVYFNRKGEIDFEIQRYTPEIILKEDGHKILARAIYTKMCERMGK